MRVFVTGASGHIGSAAIPLLLEAGHEVVGLARSNAAAAAVTALGATVQRGELRDLAGLREAAGQADAVIHLAFDHEAMLACARDAARLRLAGTQRPSCAAVRRSRSGSRASRYRHGR